FLYQSQPARIVGAKGSCIFQFPSAWILSRVSGTGGSNVFLIMENLLHNSAPVVSFRTLGSALQGKAAHYIAIEPAFLSRIGLLTDFGSCAGFPALIPIR